MSEQQVLQWPGYRLRKGWRMLATGEVIAAGDVTSMLGAEEWQNALIVGEQALGLDFFRRTDPTAELPPVEPVPVEQSVDEFVDRLEQAAIADATARKSQLSDKQRADAAENYMRDLMKVIDRMDAEAVKLLNQAETLTGERDALQKQAERLALEYIAACKENGILRVERDALRKQVAELRDAALKAVTVWPETPDWRAKLRPCWFNGRDDSGFFHGWMRDCDGSIVAIVELPTGLIDRWSTQDVRFTKPASLKEMQA